MTDAESLAAAAADECRRILAEKDRLLTAARDERDALASDLFAARQALITEGVARDAAERALSEAREALREVLDSRGALLAWGLAADATKADMQRVYKRVNEAEKVARHVLAAPVPPGETRPVTPARPEGHGAPGEPIDYSSATECARCHARYISSEHDRYCPAAPAAHPETTPKGDDRE